MIRPTRLKITLNAKKIGNNIKCCARMDVVKTGLRFICFPFLTKIPAGVVCPKPNPFDAGMTHILFLRIIWA